jgi:hypothetical protein
VCQPDKHASSYERLAPNGGASLSLSCPKTKDAKGARDTEPLTRSDADGGVHWGTVGLWPRQCSVVVSAEGYRDEVFRLSDLCVLGEADCHFISVQSELVSSEPARGPPGAPTPAATPAMETHHVRFVADRPDLLVFKLAGKSGSLRAWQPVCRPPCDAVLSKDDELAVARSDGPPVEPKAGPRLDADSPIDVHYESRTTKRRVLGFSGLAGIVAGIVLLGVGAPGENQPWKAQNIALTASGAVLDLAGALAVVLSSDMVDTVRLGPEQ